MKAMLAGISRKASFVLLALAMTGCSAQSAPLLAIPAGKSQLAVELNGLPFQVFTFRPEGCAVTKILIVFHGLGRNAAGYRDAAIPLGQTLCMVVVAPLFDAERFPSWRYQRGGVVHDGTVQPAESWTVNLVPRLIAWVRAGDGRPNLPYAFIGHSAGAQFLSRVAAFLPNEATQIVIANPSTWVRPTLTIDAPYGFGGAFRGAAGEEALRRYLAAPVTVLLGQEDVGSQNLATGDEAEAQGGTRLERGTNVFQEAEREAGRRKWAFNWRLAFVPGVGHSAGSMFASDQALSALRP